MASATPVPRLLSFADAARLDPDLNPGELVEGKWAPLARKTWRHGEIAGNAAFLLHHYARENPGWSVGAGGPGAKLFHDPDTLRGPEVGIIRLEREPTGKGAEGWLEGAPDVAVEVVGDGQTASELAKKATEYLGAGAQAVWVLDPEPQLLMLFTPPNRIRILGAEETLEGGEALPGCTCKVSEFFE